VTSLPALPPGLFDFIGRWEPPHPDTEPTRIRMSRDVYDRIRMNPPAPGSGAYPVPSFHISIIGNLLGLTVDVDNRLEPGVWQVYATDGTLLRDSRSTNQVEP